MSDSAPLIKGYSCLRCKLLSVFTTKLAYFQRGKKLSGELDFMDIKATIKTSTYSHFPSYKSILLVPQDYEQKSSFQHIDTFSQKQYDCTAVFKKYEYKIK